MTAGRDGLDGCLDGRAAPRDAEIVDADDEDLAIRPRRPYRPAPRDAECGAWLSAVSRASAAPPWMERPPRLISAQSASGGLHSRRASTAATSPGWADRKSSSPNRGQVLSTNLHLRHRSQTTTARALAPDLDLQPIAGSSIRVRRGVPLRHQSLVASYEDDEGGRRNGVEIALSTPPGPGCSARRPSASGADSAGARGQKSRAGMGFV
jgi:hypothetical protein